MFNYSHSKTYFILKAMLVCFTASAFTATAAPIKTSAKKLKNTSSPYQIELKKVLQNIQLRLTQTKNFRADFTQTFRQKVLKKSEESSGTVTFQKPGLLRWDYLKPSKKMFLANGNTLWLHQPSDKIAYVNRCFEQDALTASITFLWGQGNIEKVFNVSWLGNKPMPSKNYELALIPKEKNVLFKELILAVEPKTFLVKETIVVDHTGNLNRFVFSNLKTNLSLRKNVFTFKPSLKENILPMPGSCKN